MNHGSVEHFGVARGRIGSMVSYIGRFVAIFAMVASGINAQCAMSCSLQPVVLSSRVEKQSVHPPRAGHACCPEQKAPAPADQHRQQRQKPCSDPALTLTDLAFITWIEHSDAPRHFDWQSQPSDEISLVVYQCIDPEAFDCSGLTGGPAFTILRI